MPPESGRHCTNTLPQNTPAAPVKCLPLPPTTNAVRSSSLALAANEERVEIRGAVVGVYTLGALETANYQVGKRRGEGFIGRLDEPLGNDGGDDGSKGNSPDEGQEDEN